MAKNSLRNQIIDLLCDTSVFPANTIMYSWDVSKKLRTILPPNSISSVKSFNNSVRQSLETVDGYIYSNGTKCLSKRSVITTEIRPAIKPNPKGYNILYTFM